MKKMVNFNDFKYETVFTLMDKETTVKIGTAAKNNEVATQIAAGMIICTQLKKINTKGINPNRACDHVNGKISFAQLSNPDQTAIVIKAAKHSMGIRYSMDQ